MAEIYVQKKINQIEEENNIQDWDNFAKEVKIAYGDKSNIADAKWKIETFKQEKKYIANFIVEFEVLVIKAETNDIHAIFLLKKNVRSDIIKIILEYPLIVAPESLKEWKVAITLVRQGYKFTEGKKNYKTGLEITYKEIKVLINIRKSKDNYDKDKKPRCFNCNIYKHMVKDYQKPKKKKETRKYYKCNKVRYLVKNYKSEQKINKSIQEESEKEDSNKEESFIRDSA